MEQVEVECEEPGAEAPRCQAYVLVAEEVSQWEADLPGLDLAVVVLGTGELVLAEFGQEVLQDRDHEQEEVVWLEKGPREVQRAQEAEANQSLGEAQ